MENLLSMFISFANKEERFLNNPRIFMDNQYSPRTIEDTT